MQQKGANPRMPVCHRCRQALEGSDVIGRNDVCPQCGADLRCCLNCRHFEPGAYNQCREPQAERVLDKERANFCDCFVVRETGAYSTTRAAPKANPLDSLFRKQGPPDTKGR